eukprot:gene11690-3464_t
MSYPSSRTKRKGEDFLCHSVLTQVKWKDGEQKETHARLLSLACSAQPEVP